jgi:hypothetical protein
MRTRSFWIGAVALVAVPFVAWSCQRANIPADHPPASGSTGPTMPAKPVAVAPVNSGAVPAAVPAHAGSRVVVQVTEEGFVPNKIPAEVGKPITLAITRKTDKTCAREILFKDQPGKTELPLNKEVEATYTPKSSGTVAFGCAMGMMVGGELQVH